MQPIHFRAQRGFTLIELSIVMVIIGLILGGVLVGRHLIRSSEIRSALSLQNSIVVATNNFKDKYRQLPGDLNKATQYWGEVAANCTSAIGSGTQTCNGNGDGMVGYGAGKEYERFRFWQHLANAGMLAGQYTGGPGPNNATDSVVGSNIPSTKISGVGFWVNNDGPVWGGQTWLYQGDYGNYLLLGSELRGSEPSTVSFTAAEAYLIDTKMDDGLPGKGVVMSRTSSAHPLCATGDYNQAATSTYLNNESQPGCVLNFLRVF